MSESNVVEFFDESEFFADPNKKTRIPVPAIRGWIEVRDEISIGDERKVFSGSFKGQTQTKDGTRSEYDMEKVSFAMVVLHVTAWSLKKPCVADAFKALKPKQYRAIEEAVQKHVESVKEGNEPTSPASGVSPTSVSVA